MKKINIGFLFPLTALVLLVFALSRQMFDLPALGKLLDPFEGMVQNEDERKLEGADLTIENAGLHKPTRIFFDQRRVPHIYAENAEDLYFAQGYVTAYLRLWQMDFLSYASAGRLSEIFSEGFLAYDRNQRRIGMLESAKSSLKMIESDPETAQALNAYSNGVNAYIRQLSYKDIPFEYKLLNYAPEAWSNLKTVLIMKYMANTLAGYDEDYAMSNLMLTLGETGFNKLYPDFVMPMAPVAGMAIPGLTSPYIKKPDYLDHSFLTSGTVVPDNTYNPKLGSNSWAVSGKKTFSGAPILCNDPHLAFSLPSIWVEMQLTAPGVNVYGVSIPGTPAVIIGFNKDIAWGITNGDDDVKDWYKLKVSPDYRKYKLNGKWVDMKYSIEEIRRKGQKAFYDTVYYTVHGPVVNTMGFTTRPELVNYAMKWEGRHPTNEFLTFIHLNKARNYSGYSEAIRHYGCPIQNFTFACKDNTIAINHQGNMRLKRPGQGKFVLDGTADPLPDDYIPADSLPAMLNPSCNYVLSANQHPTGPGYSYYYNGYFSENRANRIRDLLNREDKFDIPKMEGIQLDNTSSFAVNALPVLLRGVDTSGMTFQQKNSLDSMKAWKGTYGAGDVYAALFEWWWDNIKNFTWDEFKAFNFYSRLPDNYILLDLISKDPSNDYFDRQGTSIRENAGTIVSEAFIAAVAEWDKSRKKGNLTWGDLNEVKFSHPTNIAAFGKATVHNSGHPETIDAVSGRWGPSWRMIVELGDRPTAFGIYPGGQSGNVGSPYYDNFIPDWGSGKYYKLNFFISIDEAKTHPAAVWTLQ